MRHFPPHPRSRARTRSQIHRRRAAAAGLSAFLVFALVPAAAQQPPAARTLRQIGGAHSFSPPLASAADLARLFAESRADFVTVLEKAGWEDDPEDLFRAVAAGEVEDTSFRVGGRLRWMAYRTPAKVDVIRDVLWQGKKPFPAFEIEVESKGRRSTFVVPKACGNLALVSRVGTGELTVSVSSGLVELIDAQGREITLRPGDSATVTAPGRPAGEPVVRSEVGEARVEVEEGDVEFHDHVGDVSVFLEEGNSLGATVGEDRKLALAVPGANPAPLEARFGDARARIHPGVSLGVEWPAPECVLAVSPASDCRGRPFTFDAGASSVRRGVVRTVELELVHPDGRSETLVPEQPGLFRWQRSFAAAGRYQLRAVAESNKGQRSQGECAASFEVEVCKPAPPTAAVGVESGGVALVVGDADPFAELTVDASGSRSPGGEVAKVEVTVIDPEGETVAEMVLEEDLEAGLTLERGGVYTVRAVAVDEHGQRSLPAEAPVDVYPRSSFAGWLFAGYERRGEEEVERSSAAIAFKGSWRRILGRRLELALSLGGIAGFGAEGASSLFADLELDWRLGKGFVGVGAGLWDLEDPELDVVIHGGRQLPFRLGRRPACWVLEGRLFPEELDDSFVLLGGLRFTSP